MDRNFVHFFIVYKKMNSRPIILGNMDIKKKKMLKKVFGNLGQQILLQLR